jgi:hypothetical protein
MTIIVRTRLRTTRYRGPVGVRKVSVSLDEDAFRAAEAAAGAAGISLSAWLSRAARHLAGIEDGLRAVAEYEAEYGPFSEEDRRRADEILDRLGVGRDAR